MNTIIYRVYKNTLFGVFWPLKLKKKRPKNGIYLNGGVYRRNFFAKILNCFVPAPLKKDNFTSTKYIVTIDYMLHVAN